MFCAHFQWECPAASDYQISFKLHQSKQSYDVISILRWRRRHRSSTFGFVLWLSSISKVKKSICNTKFRGDISIRGWNITTLGFSKQNRRHIEILHPTSIFTASSPLCHSASAYQILSKSDHPQSSYDAIVIFKMTARRRNSTLSFAFGDMPPVWRSKSNCSISVHGWDITTSGFWERTAVALEFYFGFPISPLRHHQHGFLHRSTKFRPHRPIRGGVMTSCMFFNMAASASQFCFQLRLWWPRSGRKERNLPADHISARYLNSRLRYYYFRIQETNVRHVGILFPVLIFTFPSPSACHSASAHQISSKSDHLRQSYDVISIFKMAPTTSRLYFRFRFSWLRSFKGRILLADLISARYLNPRLRYFRFLKTDGRYIKLYFRSRFWPFHCHGYVILQRPTKFCLNWTITDGIMTSYRFSRSCY